MTTFQTLLTGGGLAALGVVLSGLLTNWLSAKRDERRYEHEQSMGRQARDHEQAMAAEARRQERLEQAYLELLAYLSHHAEWVRSVRPFMGTVEAPDLLSREKVQQVEALVEAYGSPKVRGLLSEWREYVSYLADADVIIAMVEKSPNPSQELDDDARDEHKRIPSYRKAIFQAAEAVREQVRKELAGEA